MNTSSLKNEAVIGIFWTLVHSFGTKAIYFIVTIWLARILYPSDFGIMATGMFVIGIFNLLADFGMSMAIIQHNQQEARTISTGFWLIISFGVILSLVSLGIAPQIASFFGDNNLTLFLRVMTIAILFTALEAVPLASLNKQLKFSRRVFPEMPFMVGYGITSIVLSSKDYGAWALVMGNLVGHGIRVSAYWYSAKIPLATFSLKNVDYTTGKNLLHYGYHVVGTYVLTWLLINGDNGFVRKFLGNAQLGYYSIAYMVANIPATHLSQLLGAVTFPLYSKLQNNIYTLNKGFKTTLRLVATVNFPASVGMAVIAPQLISVLYGGKWTPIIIPLQILCVFGMMRSVLSICGNMFYAKNKHYLLKRIMLLQLIIIILTIYPSTKVWGLMGTSISITAAETVAFFLIMYYVAKILEDKMVSYLWPLLSIFFISSLMGISVYGLAFIPFNSIPFLKLFLLIIAGILIYTLLLWSTNQAIIKEFIVVISLLKQLIKKHETN